MSRFVVKEREPRNKVHNQGLGIYRKGLVHMKEGSRQSFQKAQGSESKERAGSVYESFEK